MSAFFEDYELKKPKQPKQPKAVKVVAKKKRPTPIKKVIPKTASEMEIEAAIKAFRDEGMIDD